MRRYSCLMLFAIMLLIPPAGYAEHRIEMPFSGIQPQDRSQETTETSRDPSDETLRTPGGIEAPAGTLTLGQALSLVLMRNPELAAFSREVSSKEAGALQANLLPNPGIGLEVENVGGQGIFRGLNAAEITLQFSQLIELGSKRSNRSKLASFETSLAEWDYERKRLDVLLAATIAFVDVLAAQEHLHLNEESLHLSKQVMYTVRERVRAGKASPLEETRTSVMLSSSKIKLEKARRTLSMARQHLASMWSSTSPVFEKAAGDLHVIGAIPSLNQLNSRIKQNPQMARWIIEMERFETVLDLEKANGIPDLTVGGGIRRWEATKDHAFVFGVSMSLPLFDRNQGTIQKARSELEKASEERRASDVRIRTAMSGAYESLISAYAESMSLRNDVLPAAENVFESSREGYRYGKFSFLDVLDAERTLIDVRGQHIEALAAFHRATALMKWLLGEPMDEIVHPMEPEYQGEVE